MLQSIDISFGKGLDTKTDPWRVPIGNFLTLNNMVFTVGERLTKRNGFGSLTALPEIATYLTTFNQNLTAIGTSLQALSEGTWYNKGSLQPVKLEVLPLVRSNTNQSQSDTAIAANGLICTVYTDQNPSNLTQSRYMYVIASSQTGQNVIEPTVIPVTTGTVTGSPRVFVLGAYFVIVFTNVITATSHLQYIAISTQNPNIRTINADIASSYVSSPGLSWDGVVLENHLYIAYNTTSGGQSIKLRYLTSTLVLSAITTYSDVGKVTATLMSLCADSVNRIIYASYYDSVSQNGYTLAVDTLLNKVIAPPVQIITGLSVSNITAVANDGITSIFYEVANNYGYDSSIPTHYISNITVTQAGVVSSPMLVVRSVGLASKAFIANNEYYFLAAYQSTYQSTYFLINSSGQVISRIAYGNGGGYDTLGLPSVTVNGALAQVSYLIKDFITSQNTSKTESITKSNLYSQTGINLVSFTIGTSNVVPAEIAETLNLSGGFLWEYDGFMPVENNFFLWPDNVEATPSNSGGAMVSQEYQYQAVYTWTNNQGNIERSTPSIAVIVDLSTNNYSYTQPTPITFTATFPAGSSTITVSSTTGLQIGQIITDTSNPAYIQAGTYITSLVGLVVGLSLPTTHAHSGGSDNMSVSSINKVTLNIPTLRLTYKITNPVKIEIFRWSTSQQEFFQVTSITQPLINDTTVDYVTYVDTQADNQILGNSLIYTTGGVIENVGAPSFNAMTLFDNRLWGINAEDPNQAWYSKEVIENVPVEMSDLLTRYIAPTIASQGSTGTTKCLAPMDDKLIFFKPNALYYMNGTGPDNTGANSQYSEPIFITSVVGSTNQQSIVFMPNGLMFQSDKGIWLLGRDMTVSYIGAPVEAYTKTALVQSAVAIPETTQVRFTLDSGITLMYDYFWQQWGTFTGVNAISSTLYQDKHTLLNANGQVFQETPNVYLDGSTPVTWNFKTSWINLAGLQGYQRSYFFWMLGQYITPHFLQVGIAFDYDETIVESSTITPDNYSLPYAISSPYGQETPYAGPGNREQWRVFFSNQRCQAFQLNIQEIYDASFGVPAGAGLTMSGLNCIVEAKRSYRAGPVPQSIGGGTNGSNN